MPDRPLTSADTAREAAYYAAALAKSGRAIRNLGGQWPTLRSPGLYEIMQWTAEGRQDKVTNEGQIKGAYRLAIRQLGVVEDCLLAAGQVAGDPAMLYSPGVMLRTGVEACGWVLWLMDAPDVETRVNRYLGVIRQGAKRALKAHRGLGVAENHPDTRSLHDVLRRIAAYERSGGAPEVPESTTTVVMLSLDKVDLHPTAAPGTRETIYSILSSLTHAEAPGIEGFLADPTLLPTEDQRVGRPAFLETLLWVVAGCYHAAGTALIDRCGWDRKTWDEAVDEFTTRIGSAALAWAPQPADDE